MKTYKFQKYCNEVVNEIDKKYGINRTAGLTLNQMIEELGELAKEINKPELRKSEVNIGELESELADVFLMFNKLSSIYHVDIEKAVYNKIKILKERKYLK